MSSPRTAVQRLPKLKPRAQRKFGIAIFVPKIHFDRPSHCRVQGREECRCR